MTTRPSAAVAPPNLLDYKTAATRLGMPVGTLRVMVSRKQVPYIRLGPRMVKFDPDELARWIDQHRVQGAQP
jgi:excisionase family DNA binding protein